MPRCFTPIALTFGCRHAALVVATVLIGHPAFAAFTTVAEYRLGEDDPGAASGVGGAPFTTALDGADLAGIGGATYSSDVPAGDSTLSMFFPGNGDAPGAAPDSFYYGKAPTSDVTQNITYSFDAKLGTPSSGFAFIASLGGNFGGISVLEVNGNAQVFFPGAGGGTGSFNINNGQWNRFQVDYLSNGGEGNEVTTLSINGNVVSTRTGPTANGIIVDALTLGGNWRGPGGIEDTPVLGSETLDRFEGGFNGWIDNFLVQTFIEPLLTLEVNKTTGETRLLNDTGETIEFDFYTIGSAAGALNAGGSPADANRDGRVDGADFLILQQTELGLIPLWEEELGTTGSSGGGWNSLQAQNADGFPAGNGSGNGWEQSGGSNNHVLTEAYLTAAASFEDGVAISLGTAFDPAVFGAGIDGDLTFRFRKPTGGSFDGNIVYVSSASLGGVPEPSTSLLALLGCALMRCRNRSANRYRCSCVAPPDGKPQGKATWTAGLVVAIVLPLALGSPARAEVTVDRLYRFGDGDNDSGTPLVGATVGSTTSTGDTFDDVGTSGNFTLIDLTPFGGPTYANVAARPLAGGSTLGISFDGVDDYLTGFRLGLPETSVSSTLSTQVNPLNLNDVLVGGLDYTGITNRGFQLWVNPADANLGNGLQQAVVRDTNQHGVSISGTGTWIAEYGGQQFDTGVAVKRDNELDGSAGWHHVMLVRPAGAGGGARLYVDGMGIGAIGGGYNGADANYLTVGAATGNLANDNPDDNPGQGAFFRGVMDDLQMFVLGGTLGSFDFAADNQFAAAQLADVAAADVNRDGQIDQADVAAFAPNFDTGNVVNGVTLPDLAFRDQGDLNLDGRIDLLDAFILHQGLLAAGQGGLNFAALGSVVPEPAAWLLLMAATSGVLARRRPPCHGYLRA